MENRSTRVVAGATAVEPVPDIVEQLLAHRDMHAEIVRVELRNDPPNYGIVGEHDRQSTLLYVAAETITRLRKQRDAMAATLHSRKTRNVARLEPELDPQKIDDSDEQRSEHAG
jgi:hypothetical protein